MNLTALLLLLSALPPEEMERQAQRHVLLEYERVGRRAPQVDFALKGAARRLAEEALATSATEAADLLTIIEAVSMAGGSDPSPRALLIRGRPPEESLASFLKRQDFNDEPATHASVAVAMDQTHSALVVLLSDRSATLEPFPRTLAPGTRQTLRGSLATHLEKAQIFVTLPSGAVQKFDVPLDETNSFSAPLSFPSPGRHTVEVIARGARGPEVAALFLVEVGPKGTPARAREAEPQSPEKARAAITFKINALRRSAGLSEVATDEALEQIAGAYAERMAQEGFFAHLSPEGGDLRSRLKGAQYSYQAAGENLGLANGPLGAHFSIEHSPAHRSTLLEPAYSRLGLGLAQRPSVAGGTTLLVEILAAPLPPPKDPLEAVYGALQAARSARQLPALLRSAALERLAREHARKALELSMPTSQLPGVQLHQQVFESLKEAASSSVDVFVADHPSQVGQTRSLLDPRNTWVGVGVIRGDSLRYGEGKFWVVIIYAKAR